LSALVRAVYRAAVWCDAPENRTELAALLAARDMLDLRAAVIDDCLERRHIASAAGGGFLVFAEGGATIPRPDHAKWFVSQMRRWNELPPGASVADAVSTYRPDLYRAALAPLGIAAEEAAPLAPFFDGKRFAPETD
jgi:hypothetical protein